jgi:hypothetical protein
VYEKADMLASESRSVEYAPGSREKPWKRPISAEETPLGIADKLIPVGKMRTYVLTKSEEIVADVNGTVTMTWNEMQARPYASALASSFKSAVVAVGFLDRSMTCWFEVIFQLYESE